MSTTLQSPTRNKKRNREDAAWRPSREAGKTVITIQPDDPFQSLLSPSYDPGPLQARKSYAFAAEKIQPETRPAYTSPRGEVEPKFTEPAANVLEREYVDRSEYRKAKSSARDAWAAVVLMGMFIAGGVYWAFDKISGDQTTIEELGTKVEDLGKQLTSERGVVIARNQQIQDLTEKLAAEKAKNRLKR
jgi:hypothetical protein